jgi:thiol:disulfide interchange protein DsbD
MKSLLKLLILASSLIGAPSFADSFSTTIAPTSISAVSKSNDFTNSGPTFLPVHQAFQLQAELSDDRLILNWDIADNYYLYQKSFKFKAVSDELSLDTPLFADGLQKWDEYFEADVVVYYGTTTVEVPYTSRLPVISVEIESQGCADAGLCYPPRKELLTVDTSTGITTLSEPAKTSPATSQPSQSSFSLGLILIFALAGGLILNLMPCVFPILSIKVLSFTQQHQTSSARKQHGLAYTLGVVLSFIAIAGLMLSLRAGGEAIGWGFQLQSPGFVIFLVYLFTFLGLSLSGYMQIFTGLMSVGQSTNTSSGLTSSFMTGVLATTVASPCTAPFMGPALGFAISQNSGVALLVFAFLGLGMALPFVALTLIPSLATKLPKPGQWMENLKQFLAFPMYLTALWLLWVAGRQTGVDVVIAVVTGLVLMVLAIWLWQLATKVNSSGAIFISKLLAVLALVAAVAVTEKQLNQREQVQPWQDYSPQRLDVLRSQGAAVFVNMSADWCITCLVNERVAMGDKFYASLKSNDVTYLKGDWTFKDPQITQLLNQYNRNGVPLYLLFSSGSKEAEVLPQILTESLLVNKINQL